MTLDSPSPRVEQSAIEQAMQLAVAQHRAGELQEAEKLYQAVLQLSPEHPEANHNLGALALQRKDPAAGLPHFVAALNADPTRAQYWLSYIDALFHAGQLDDAREVLALARQNGLQGEEVETLAAFLEAGGQADAGKQIDSFESNPVQAQSENRAKKNAGKSAHLDKKALSTDQINALINLFNQGRYEEVVARVEPMSVSFPQNGLVWKILGAALKQLRRNAEALAPMQRAAKLLPNDAEIHSNLGGNLQDLGLFGEAETSLKRALKINPRNADALSNLSLTLQQLGRFDEAEANCRRALQIKPDFAEAHNNLALALKSLGRLDEAEASCRRALQIKPSFAEAHNNLGVILKSLGKLDEAEASCRQALQFGSGSSETHSNLGMILQSQGRLDEALVHFQECFRLSPGNVIAQHHIASLTGQNTERAPDQYVENVFDSYADKFDMHLQQVLLYDIPIKLVALIAQRLPAGAKCRVLDLGCGTGLIGPEVAPFARQLVGVDLSAKMLEKARTRKVYQRLVRSDLLTMMQNEPALEYDLVIAADVFVYVGRLDEIVAEIKKLLSSGGIFAFSTESMETVDRAGPGYLLENTGRYAHSVGYLTGLASANGFQVLEMVPARIRTEQGKPVNGHMAVWKA